jgi:predicted transcriptional regulator of viral defense system
MSAASALARLRALGKPVVTTNDAALVLGAERSAATQTLKRLAVAGLLKRIRHGLWATDLTLDPLLLPEYLTAPFPSYVSFQSALFLRGMVSQIPEVIYVASLAQPRRVTTSLGTFSIHRLAPPFFGGYESVKNSGVRLATPEKALLDTLYLGPARSGLFAHLPEVELPEHFDRDRMRFWVGRISAGPRRRSVELRLAALLATHRRGREARSARPGRPARSHQQSAIQRGER